MKLQEMMSELERQQTTRRDIVADSRELSVVPTNTEIEMMIPFPDGHVEHYPLTEWGHGQLAEKCGIPQSYYKRMIADHKFDLLTENVNAYIYEEKNRLIRVLDNRVRAILSDGYWVMNNNDLLLNALNELKPPALEGVKVARCDLTETFMYVKFFQETELVIKGNRHDFTVYPGLVLSNSEVGAAKIKAEPALVNPSCKNIFIAEAQFAKVHIDRKNKRGIGEIRWADDTLRAHDQATWLEIRDIVKSAFDQEVIENTVKRLATGATNEIVKPTRAVDAIAAEYKLSEQKKKDLLDYFTAEEEHTQLGLANAIARFAQDATLADDQVSYEHAAFSIGSLAVAKFNKLVEGHAAVIEARA